MTTNYFTFETGNIVKLHGFEQVHGCAYIHIPFISESIVVGTETAREKENCFRIAVSEDRTVRDDRLFHLLNHYELWDRVFILVHGSYYPTNIPA